MKIHALITLSLLFVSLASESAGYQTGNSSRADQAAENASPVAPDNTEINQRDNSSDTLTPEDQSNSQADLDISSAIRKTIVAERFSTTAKNIKIITINGDVTLRGPVDTQAEKDEIERLASTVVGVKKLSNQLEVKAVSTLSE